MLSHSWLKFYEALSWIVIPSYEMAYKGKKSWEMSVELNYTIYRFHHNRASERRRRSRSRNWPFLDMYFLLLLGNSMLYISLQVIIPFMKTLPWKAKIIILLFWIAVVNITWNESLLFTCSLLIIKFSKYVHYNEFKNNCSHYSIKTKMVKPTEVTI